MIPLKEIAAFTSPNVFNPWSDQDPLDDRDDGAMYRRLRLQDHFNVSPTLILIGEAPGYQGCHFSGVPFTNEKLILDRAIPRIGTVGRITKRERPWCEPSATIVWRTLHELDLAEKVVMWNAFAWHPYKPGNPMSNRAPTRQELDRGCLVLEAVLEYFHGIPIVPVGRVAEKSLKNMGIKTLSAVRHPSMGGATEFRNMMKSLAAQLIQENRQE